MNSSTPQLAFDGQCAFAVSIGKDDVEGSPRHQLQQGDTIYQFKNGVARFLWRVLPGRQQKSVDAWANR